MDIYGNYYDKYNTKNKFAQKMMSGFFSALKECCNDITFSTMLEAGCGEGNIFRFMRENFPLSHLEAFDLGEDVVAQAKVLNPSVSEQIFSKDIYSSGYADGSFDLVLCSEVLEHLEQPGVALAELMRITRRYLLVSVPKEPIWRILNMARFKYIKHLGNTPGHIQHWSASGFLKLLTPYGNIRKVEKPFPWTMVLLEKVQEEK